MARGEAAALNEQRTADNIVQVLPAEVITSLPNTNIADAVGRLPSGAHPQLALEYERRSQDPNDTLDGGESLNQFYERVRTTLRRILAQHQSGAILIVGHGGTNQMIARALLSLSVEEARAFQQDNDELYLFVVDHETARRVWKLVNVKSRPSVR